MLTSVCPCFEDTNLGLLMHMQALNFSMVLLDIVRVSPETRDADARDDVAEDALAWAEAAAAAQKVDAEALAEILRLNPHSCLAREVRTMVKDQRIITRVEPGGCCGLGGKTVSTTEPFDRVDVAPSRGWGVGTHNGDDSPGGTWRGVKVDVISGQVARLGGAVQVDSVKTCVQSVPSLSARNLNVMQRYQTVLSISSCAATP